MTKWVGAIVVLLWSWATFTGIEPFGAGARERLPPDAKRGPGGVLIWHSGFFGGK